MEGLNLVSGLEVGFGGVWIGAAPYLLFVPIKEGEDKPAGQPQDPARWLGLSGHARDANTFIWGPDGWLYGCHGVFTHSRVGKPGTPDKERTPINAGVWRYHPTKHVFEVFAHGTSNPWGLDFNDHGHAFIDGLRHPAHLAHHSGRPLSAAGRRSTSTRTPTTTSRPSPSIGTMWAANPHGGNGSSDSAGGGHAHCGAMIYQGGTWPKEYRGKMFMGNIHGHRINVDMLTPKGSGYTATASPDFLLANDAGHASSTAYGPDGNVYLIDWYDKQACHHGDPNIWDRNNGRIYKICWKDAKPVKAVDLQKLSDKELVELQLHENDWYVRHARRILQERVARKKLSDEALRLLGKIARSNNSERIQLRVWWTLDVTESTLPPINLDVNEIPFEHLKAWGYRGMDRDSVKWFGGLGNLLLDVQSRPNSPIVRLAIAGTLGRKGFPHEDVRIILAELLSHAEDSTDHNLPLMYWYAAEPLASVDPSKALDLVINGKIPLLQSFMARRIASAATPEAMKSLVIALGKTGLDDVRLRLLQGINEGLRGRRDLPTPESWAETFRKLSASKNAEVRSQSLALAITFGDASAFKQLRESLSNPKVEFSLRQNALQTLVAARDKELPPVLLALIGDAQLQTAALRGLASYDDTKTPQVILKAYPSFNTEAKRDALATLTSRLAYAKELMQAVATKKIPATDLSADLVRQLLNFNDKSIEKQLGQFWGTVRTTPADRRKLIAQWKNALSTPEAMKADLHLGRAVFAKTCQQCHTLYGVGAKIGPEITGANRANLDYLLENILDPSAVIPKEYAATTIALLNGRSVLGIVKSETPAAVQIQTATELLTIARSDIETVRPSAVSMMPDDLLKPLKQHEIAALFAYLKHPQQVAILATAENVKDFFNGKDLTGWYGDAQLWKVENGEIVGKSPGIKKNEFLKSQYLVGDFHLKLKVKLTPDKENSGIQFRSEVTPEGEVQGYQADVGAGWWGKLYEENGRALLWNKPGDDHVKVNDWNEYEIIAVGSKIRTYINGNLCVDLDDPKGAKRGIFALQIHSGGAMEVRYKDLQLILDPKSDKR